MIFCMYPVGTRWYFVCSCGYALLRCGSVWSVVHSGHHSGPECTHRVHIMCHRVPTGYTKCIPWFPADHSGSQRITANHSYQGVPYLLCPIGAHCASFVPLGNSTNILKCMCNPSRWTQPIRCDFLHVTSGYTVALCV